VTGAFRLPPHVVAAAACCGLAAANLVRGPWLGVAAVAGGLAVGSAIVGAEVRRIGLLALALFAAGWWWGSARLDALDRSPLAAEIGRGGRALVVVTAPPRRGRYEQRVQAELRGFGELRVQESVLVELPVGRSPPQGAVLGVLGVLRAPRGPEDGFDERTYLRRHGIHVVLKGESWRVLGRRGGLGGVADRIRRWLGSSLATGLEGERRALLQGIVLGDDQSVDPALRDSFRASGLYHLLAVSGQNVAIVAGGVLGLVWILGLPRWLGQLGALGAIAAYVLAVGMQPSVVRAGIAGALGVVAWLSARATDRWYFLLVGAFALLAWNPYTLLDPGFQLSFAAVAAIFTSVPWLKRALEGYPAPRKLAGVVAISTACGLVTAPILWLQFHAVPLLSVPANALAAPAMAPLLALALATAVVAPLWPGAAALLAWLNGWCAAYLATCARLVAALPFAQVRSGLGAAALAACALVAGAYAWSRWHRT
jgi:competence protein ComEC